jgi:hypothetical protein
MRQKQTDKIISEIDPPAYLKKAVFERIAKENQKQIIRKKMLYFGGFSVSIIGIFASIGFFGRNIIASDFWSIGSLFFTDMKAVTTYWQEYILSLLETFPVEPFAFILTPIFILLVLARQYAESLQSYEMFTKYTKVQKI